MTDAAPCVVFVTASDAGVWQANFSASAPAADAVACDDLTGDLTAATEKLAAFLHALDRAPYHLVAAGRTAVNVCRVVLDEPALAASCTLVNAWPLAPGGARGPLDDDAAALGRARGEIYRALIQRGMPCPTLLVWSIDDPAGDRDRAAALNELFVQRRRETEMRYVARAGAEAGDAPPAFNRMLAAFVADAATTTDD